MSKDGKSGGKPNMTESDEIKKRRRLHILCLALAAAFLLAAIACVVVYAVARLDVMFIPMALCSVAAMISFTYARIKG